VSINAIYVRACSPRNFLLFRLRMEVLNFYMLIIIEYFPYKQLQLFFISHSSVSCNFHGNLINDSALFTFASRISLIEIAIAYLLHLFISFHLIMIKKANDKVERMFGEHSKECPQHSLIRKSKLNK